MENKSKEIEIDKTVAEKIKTLQSLPEEIVINLLKSKGALASTNFKSKFILHAKQN